MLQVGILRDIRKFAVLSIAALMLALALLVVMAGAASAQAGRGTPARTETLAAGPYLIDVNLYAQPYTDTPFDIAVVPHDSGLRLTGQLMAIPSSEIDATKLRVNLSPDASQPWVLAGSARLPVRGAWTLAFSFNGPHGSANTSFVVDVAAPGAMPTWLAWVIGIMPVIAIAAWFLFQHRYRRALALKQQGQLSGQGV